MKLQSMVAVLSLALMVGVSVGGAGCTSTPTQESLGESVDDSVITTKVKSAFVEDKTVDAIDISVETFKGTVQLSGFAKSQAQIDRAIEIARSTKGVRSVRNSIQLRASSPR